MRSSIPRRTLAIATAGLLFVTGCAPPPPSSRAAGAAPATAADPARTPASMMVLPTPAVVEKYQWANVMVPESPSWRLLEKVVAATGGTAVVDAVTTLVSTGKLQMKSPGGTLEATVTTTFLYPDKLRREVVFPNGTTISTTFTPARAWVTGPTGLVELPSWEKQQLEESAMRTPLSLLKARRHKLFRVAAGDPVERNGAPRETLLFRLAGETTEAVLDADHKVVELSWETPTPSADGTKKRIRLRYSDFRTLDGLVCPYYVDTFAGEELDSTLRIESLRVNQPLPPGLFDSKAATPSPSPTPQARATPGGR